MNIKEKLTCKYCYQIYQEPITLVCCGESLCKHHINELLAIGGTNTFLCPFCNEKNVNQNFPVSKTIKDLLDVEVHKFDLDPKYKIILNNLKIEIANLEAILKDPEYIIYEQINELKMQVDLNRESLKIKIDELADDLIKQLESYEKEFKTECKSKVDMKHYISLVEASKQQFNEYEKYLNLLSSKTEERDKQSKETEIKINNLQSKIKKLNGELFLNKSIIYKPMEINKSELFGKLEIRVNVLNLK